MMIALKSFLLSDVRQRFIRGIAGLWVLMVILLLVAGELSFGEQRRIFIDFGFSLILLASIGIGIWSAGLRYHQYRGEGLWAFLALQGFSRWQMMALLGLVTLIHQICFVLVSSLVLRTLLFVCEFELIESAYWIATFGVFFDSFIVALSTLLLAFWIRPFLLLPLGFAFSLIGHAIELFFDLASKRPGSIIYYVSEVVRTVFPHLYRLNFRHAVTDQIALNMTEVTRSFTYAGAWCVLLLLVTSWAFNKRELI